MKIQYNGNLRKKIEKLFIEFPEKEDEQNLIIKNLINEQSKLITDIKDKYNSSLITLKEKQKISINEITQDYNLKKKTFR